MKIINSFDAYCSSPKKDIKTVYTDAKRLLLNFFINKHFIEVITNDSRENSVFVLEKDYKVNQRKYLRMTKY